MKTLPSDVAAPLAEPVRLTGSVRPVAVLTHGDAWLGRELIVDVYEPVLDPGHSSAARTNEVALDLPDVGTAILCLGASRTDAEARAGVMKSLPADLRPPFRVRGTLVRADEREARSGRVWRIILARSIEPLEWPDPEELSSPQAILDDRERLHGRYVTVEGSWYGGFEASYLRPSDEPIWLDFHPDALRCPVPDCGYMGAVEGRLRVTGFLHTNGGYGHLSASSALLRATVAECVDAGLQCDVD